MNWLFHKLIMGRCYREARRAREMEQSKYEQKGRLLSGADTADAPRWGILARAWAKLGYGVNIDAVIDQAREEWINYCKEVDDKIKAAPKLKSGPMSGCSSIHYKYCDPARIEDNLRWVRKTYQDMINYYKIEKGAADNA